MEIFDKYLKIYYPPINFNHPDNYERAEKANKDLDLYLAKNKLTNYLKQGFTKNGKMDYTLYQPTISVCGPIIWGAALGYFEVDWEKLMTDKNAYEFSSYFNNLHKTLKKRKWYQDLLNEYKVEVLDKVDAVLEKERSI